VSGRGKFKALSKEYAAEKKEETGVSDPNLDRSGDMIRALDYRIVGDKLEIGVYGPDAGKADGHNNFSGESTLPLRRFLPAEGETYKPEIKAMIDDTLRFYQAENATVKPSELKEIETKSDLYDLLQEKIGNFSRKKLKQAALVNPELSELLQDYDLLDLL
jgi:hypothetical protein